MVDDVKKVTPPYTSFKSLVNLISELRETGLPSHVDVSVAKGSNSGKSTMVASLKAMGLTRSNNTPTDKLATIVGDESGFQGHIAAVVYETYPFLFDQSIDLTTTTTEKVKEKFHEAGAAGSTATKCIAFFLAAAKAAGIPVSARVKAPSSATAGRVRHSRKGGQNGGGTGAPVVDLAPETLATMEAPEGMEKITVPLRGMPDAVMFFPDELDEESARRAVRSAVFILESFYSLEGG